MHIAALNPLANANDINEEIINKEKELISEELKNSGKPSAKKLVLVRLINLKKITV